ncbi:MAG: hypothetical protein JW910_06700 [Anaerolineae bacterium]|nr:hypothetical protein [Anaerolineae bacterium]
MPESPPTLAEIIARKRKQIAQQKVVTPLASLRALAGMMRFRPKDLSSVLRENRVTLIGQVRRYDPAGADGSNPGQPYDPVALARQLVTQGVQALIVATDAAQGGGVEHLTLIKQAVHVPVIRQDYIVDEYQVVETRAAGGDGLLLLANVLDSDTLRGLISVTQRNLLTEIVQVHSAEELETVLPFEPRVIAICNHVHDQDAPNLDLTSQLVQLVPGHIAIMSMGGLDSVTDVATVMNGPDGVLLGPELLFDPESMGAVRRLFDLDDPPRT